MSRTNLILLVIFGMLLVTVLIVENPFSENNYELTQRSTGFIYPHLDADKVGRLEIIRDKEKVTVLKDATGQWVLPELFGYRAQEGRVKTLVQNISRFRNNQLLEDNVSETDTTFGVGDKGTRIRVSDASGSVIVDFVRGDIPVNWNDKDAQRKLRKLSAYLRKSDEKKVYLVEDFPPVIVSPKDWVDTSLVRFEAEKVREIELMGSLVQGEIALKRDGEDWKLTKPSEAPAKKEAAAAIARSLSAAYFKELVGPVDDLAKYELAEPQLRVKAKLDTGEQFELWIGKQLDDKSYYATKGPNDKYVYTVHAYTVDALKKTEADLKFVPPPPPEKKEEPSQETPKEENKPN